MLNRRRLAVIVLLFAALVTGCSSTRPTDSAGLAANTHDAGTPVDRWSVYDPVRNGEPVPVGYRPVLARDDILPVYRPTFTSPSRVDWPGDSLVIGVEIGGEARAYPVAFLARREMVIDRHRGIPTLVSW